MNEETKTDRQWLVTGVRYRDLKDNYAQFLSELKEGMVMQVSAALRENGVFKNLGVYAEWQGTLLNVGVISSMMRDVAATYLDDDGEMEVRVVKDRIGDKDFWGEPLIVTPLRPIAPHSALPPLPFDANLVPFRTDDETIRSLAARRIKNRIRNFADNLKYWSFDELGSQTDELVKMLRDFRPICLHSLCREEHASLCNLIVQLKALTDALTARTDIDEDTIEHMQQIKSEVEIFADIEREYSKKDTCARIYIEEKAEVERQIRKSTGLLLSYCKQLHMEHNSQTLLAETYISELNKVNLWLMQFMNSWYMRAKDDIASLAHIIESEQLTRSELYSYYCCEILAKLLKQTIDEDTDIDELLGEPTETPLEPTVIEVQNDAPHEGFDPEQIVNPTCNKQNVLKSVLKAQEIINGTNVRYYYLMKAMIDHRVINLKHEEYSKFARFIQSCLQEEKIDIDKMANSLRKGSERLKRIHSVMPGHTPSQYWVWGESSEESTLCTRFGEILTSNGLPKPRSRQ